jgi:DNA mismatch repair protein MutL
MTARIKLLPSVLINKIAAGEVIERPSSVVKELVENSLDAHARSVEIIITDGGLSLIEVNDDGDGMEPADLRLAVQRHATSKVAELEDLFRITSFGFRGEALPSISSVSRFLIKSRPRGSDHGFLIEIEGGTTKREEETGCDFGTFVTVRNLFFNTPARRKFLKSAAAEVRSVLQAAEWLSLANPSTGFSLLSDSRQLLDLQSADSKFERAEQLFGVEETSKFVRSSAHSDNLSIEVFLARPEICRRARGRVQMLVNGRRIESRTLFAAMMSAYGEFLPTGLFPSGVVFIAIDPELVDVNVHPAKSEVRFSDERSVFHLLHRTVREGLLSGQAVPGYQGRFRAVYQVGSVERTRDSVRGFFDRQTHRGSESEKSLHSLFQGQAADTAASEKGVQPDDDAPVTQVQTDVTDKGRAAVAGLTDLRLHQIAGLYIVAIASDSLMIVDQHAAHERILYEAAMRSFRKQAIAGQQLLFPTTLHLDAEDFYVFQKEQAALTALGFTTSEFGPRQVQLEAVPALLGNKSPEVLFRELLDDFRGLSGDEEKRLKKRAASFACRAAIMAGDRLGEAQIRELLTELLTAENPYVCPHGRPTLIRISKHELDLKFGR